MPAPEKQVTEIVNVRRKIYEFLVEGDKTWQRLTPQAVEREFSGLTADTRLHLEQLEREGVVTLGPTNTDQIALIPTFAPVSQFHVSDRIAPGPSLSESTVQPGCIALDLRGVGVPMGRNQRPYLVRDDSMIDAGIQRGDIAFLCDAPVAEGEIVCVELDGKLVLRRYLVIAGIPHVLAENTCRPDLRFALNLDNQGIFWGLVRCEHPRKNRGRRNVSYPGTHGDVDPPEPREHQIETKRISSRRQKEVTLPQPTSRFPKGTPPLSLPEPPDVMGLNESKGHYTPDYDGCH